MNWQPIETAPIEGLLLLWSENLKRPVVDCWGFYDIHNSPKWTHWMPLPEPPR